MDDTNTTTSSSAAAVADGASAAASTKTVGTTTSGTKPSSYVKLLIKASNQQFDDQVIESDFSWTVKRLKSHLSMVYPNKPPVAEQKLIYSGQLLNDNLQLKDVIRSYKDVYTQNHIIHLVYTPKNLPPAAPASTASKKIKSTTSATGHDNMTTEDGLRQRHTATNSDQVASDGASTSGQQMTPELMSYYANYLPQTVFANSLARPPMPQNVMAAYAQYNIHAMAMQQSAMYSWMHQVYLQYMEQCLRVSNAVNGSSDVNVTRSGVAGTTLPDYSTIPQYPFLPHFPQSVIPSVNQATQFNAAAAATANQQVEPPQQQDQADAEAQVAIPRFPNMAQDEPDNRDWLDNIFSVTRLAFFLTILYFNSSPFRCLAVVIIAGGIYLYHIGVFRFRNERNNNNLNRNNNAAQNAAVDQIRQGIDQQQPQQEPGGQQAIQENIAADNNTPADPNGDSNEQPTTANSNAANSSDSVANNESMISTVRTFVVTFFTSLLPETPAV